MAFFLDVKSKSGRVEAKLDPLLAREARARDE
jgi:hypothetical protein